MVTFLRQNGYDLRSEIDEAEEIIRQVASASVDRESWTNWVVEHIVVRKKL